MDIIQIFDRFPSETAFIEAYILGRYGDTMPACSRCGEFNCERLTPRLFRCRPCQRKFSVFKNTLLERARMDLRKYFYALVKLSSHGRKGISSCELARDMGITQKTAWKLLTKIRKAMARQNDTIGELSQIIEIDEVFIGGRPRKANCKWINATESPKMPVVTIVERPADGRPGRVKSIIPEPDHKGRRLTQPKMTDLIEEQVDMGRSEIHTDEAQIYKELESRGAIHNTVLHAKRYVDAMGHVHINTAESFHALPKRMHIGVYHKFGKESRHIQPYMDEAAYRWNHRREKKETLFTRILELILFGGRDQDGGSSADPGDSWPPPMGPLSYGQQELFD